MFSNFTLTKLSRLWLLVLAIAIIIVSFSNFKSESNDSKYYSDLVVRYQGAGWKELISPVWGENYWGYDPKTYLRDQFPGQLLTGALVNRLGIPADQSLHVLGMIYLVFSLIILCQIAYEQRGVQAAIFMASALLITPLSFSYNVRANHELGIMFFVFLAFYSGFSYSKKMWWGGASIFSCVMLLLIKGPFFIFGLSSFFLGYVFSFSTNKKNLSFLVVLILSFLAVVLTLYTYESLFKFVTQESFLKEFWRIQIEQRAMASEQKHFFIVQKFINFWYYFSHYLVYSLPLTLVLIITIIWQRRMRTWWSAVKTIDSLLWLSSSMVFCAFFSMSDRLAGRYVFPGYFLFSAWCAFLLFEYFPQVKVFIEKYQRELIFGIPSFWLFQILLHFIF